MLILFCKIIGKSHIIKRNVMYFLCIIKYFAVSLYRKSVDLQPLLKMGYSLKLCNTLKY